jgi:hypothetical protein
MTLILAIAAMVCLCLSMLRHQRDLFSRPLGQGCTHLLRYGGFSLLFLSAGFAGVGGAVSVVRWIGEVMVAMLLVVLFATLCAHRR